MNEENIRNAFKRYSTDKHHVHGYERYYNQVFNTPINSILEIGIKKGNSLAAWRSLFPEARICGMDVTSQHFNSKYLDYAKPEIFIKDSTSFKINGKYDVIIDDGSHFYKDIIRTFFNLKDNFTKYYVIEDAMYKQDFIVKYINKLGFKKVEIFDSNLKNYKLRKSYVTKKPKDDSITYYVDLKFIVVTI